LQAHQGQSACRGASSAVVAPLSQCAWRWVASACPQTLFPPVLPWPALYPMPSDFSQGCASRPNPLLASPLPILPHSSLAPTLPLPNVSLSPPAHRIWQWCNGRGLLLSALRALGPATRGHFRSHGGGVCKLDPELRQHQALRCHMQISFGVAGKCLGVGTRRWAREDTATIFIIAKAQCLTNLGRPMAAVPFRPVSIFSQHTERAPRNSSAGFGARTR